MDIAVPVQVLIIKNVPGQFVVACFELFHRPHGTGDSNPNLAAGLEHAENLLEGFFGVRDVVQDAHAADAVKAVVRERQGFGIALHVVQAEHQAAQSGEPSEVYIDRLTPPTLSTWPVIDQTGYSLLLHYQTYSPDLRDSGGDLPHGLPAAWQRWAELATAADIGDGPLGRLPGPRLQMLTQKAEAAKRELKAWNNREHTTRRAVAYRDF